MRHVPKTPRPAWLFLLAASLVGASAVVPAVIPSTAVASPVPPAPIAQSGVTNTLFNGESMTLTEELVSDNRKYRLKLIGDGNLVVFKPDWEPAWYSNTGGKLANKVTMQPDGNLVMTKDDVPVWSTQTSVGSGGTSTVARLANSGSLQVVRDDTVIWSTPPASDDPDTAPTIAPPRPTTTRPTATTTRPTATTSRPAPSTSRPTSGRPTSTRPVPTSTTWEPEPTVTTTRPRPTSTRPPRPTTTKPVPTTTEAPEPTTTRPRPTSTRPPRPTTTKPVPTTTTEVPEPEPTTTDAPEPTTEPVPTTTKPVPTTTTTAPPSDSQLGDKVAKWAKSQIGKAFTTGAGGPDTWGTLELVRAAWRQGGVTLPTTMQDIYDQGVKVSYDERRPGDIIVFDAPISGVNHLAIYVGDDRLVEARAIAGVHITLVYDTQRLPVVIRPGAQLRAGALHAAQPGLL